MQMKKTDSTLPIENHTRWSEAYCPTLLRVSFHNHCRIVSLLACINSTPKVLALTVLMTLLCLIGKSLKYINVHIDTTTAIKTLESDTNL